MDVSIDQLHAFARSNDVKKVLEYLYHLRETGDKKKIEELFDLFSDDYDIMDSVVNVVETLPHLEYVKIYLNHVENIYANAPIWAGILLARIVNNANTFSILKGYLANNASTKELIAKISMEVWEKPDELPQF